MISIIVPVYNTATYLERCIESVIEQTYPDWELILIDDGSTDGSGEICDRYASEDPRITTVHTPNRGVSSARNTGLDHAKGEWISFMDSDDSISPTYLEDLITSSRDADIVVSGWQRGTFKRFYDNRIILRSDFFEVLSSKAIHYNHGKLFRRDVVEKNHIRFETEIRWSEDIIFFFNVLLHSSKVILISKVNYYYRIREDSAITRLHPFENELAAVKAVDALMPSILEVCTKKALECFNTYQFILRAFCAVNEMHIGYNAKYNLLKSIKFNNKYLQFTGTTIRERIFYYLIFHKQWMVILLLNK